MHHLVYGSPPLVWPSGFCREVSEKIVVGVGHLAVGLMLKRADPRVNLGLLFFAALLLDFLLGVFFWVGIEQAYIPANYQHLHYLTFSFPYSHSLAASLLWSGLVFLLAKVLWPKGDGTKVAIPLGLAVFSHFILDVIVHVPEMPVLDRDSYKLGLGLWNRMGVALTLKMLLVALALASYLNRKEGGSVSGRYGILILMVVFSILTVVGMMSSAPPSITGAAVSWVLAPVVLSEMAFWLDRKGLAKL